MYLQHNRPSLVNVTAQFSALSDNNIFVLFENTEWFKEQSKVRSERHSLENETWQITCTISYPFPFLGEWKWRWN